MVNRKGSSSMLIPSATVFISSACIMILELVAGRLIARHLGSSLYTWTAVIGVVLAGITIGNYAGGRIADKFRAQKALSLIFILSSAACVAVIILNNLIGNWIWLWKLSWPVRVFTHVTLVFLGPSLLLGMISPVVAKMALDRGLSAGRTVGDIYACGAAGSIVGTFAAGFFLIPAIGTIAIVWSVGAALLIMGILYQVRLRHAYVWLTVFLCALFLAASPAKSIQNIGSSIGLREKSDSNILYQDETAYCYVAVKQVSKDPDKRLFMQDKLLHSQILMDDRYNLDYFYTVIFAAVSHGLCDGSESPAFLHIGGGGYVVPQYIARHWPKSRNDVVEIDPGITKAASAAFGLAENPSISTIQMDARNYIDSLIQKKRQGQQIRKYDIIFEDAFSDYSVPYQLVTKEFNDKIYAMLTDAGVYVINAVDVYNSGLFVGRFLNTLEQTFPHIYIAAQKSPKTKRNVFVIIAAKTELDAEKYIKQYRPQLNLWMLGKNDLQLLRNKAEGKILTDNYAPVENLLTAVLNINAKDWLTEQKLKNAEKLKTAERIEDAIAEYCQIVKIDPTLSVMAYNEIAIMKLAQGKLPEGIELLKKAVAYNNEKADFKDNLANLYVSLAAAYKHLGEAEKSRKYYRLAIDGYREEPAAGTNLSVIVRLGDVLAEIGNFEEAEDCFEKAVDLEPADAGLHTALVFTLQSQGKYDKAIAAVKKALPIMQKYRKIRDFQKLTRILETLESQNTVGSKT